MNNTRSLVLGAMLSCIYIVVFLTLNSFFNLADSMIFMFVPIPISIYVYKYDIKYGIMCLVVVTAISLLIGNPLNSLFFVLPNLGIGVIFGWLYKKEKINKMISIVCLVILCFIFDFLATYVFAYLFGINNLYEINEIAELVGSIFSGVDKDSLVKILKSVIPTVYIIIAFLKAFIILIIDEMIFYKLKIKEQIKIKKLPFSIGNGICYGIIVMMAFLVTLFINRSDNIMFIILYNIIYVLFFVYSILIFIQVLDFYSIIWVSRNKIGCYYIMSIVSFILFPLTLIFGIIVNFLNISKIILYLK